MKLAANGHEFVEHAHKDVTIEIEIHIPFKESKTMTTTELDSVTQTLKEQESKLLEAISELEDSISVYRGDLERIQGAIAALQQKPKKKRKAPSKPSASKADVESALMGAKDSNPEATDDQLRAIAEKQLVEQGFSRSGLALRFKQVAAQLKTDEAVRS